MRLAGLNDVGPLLSPVIGRQDSRPTKIPLFRNTTAPKAVLIFFSPPALLTQLIAHEWYIFRRHHPIRSSSESCLCPITSQETETRNTQLALAICKSSTASEDLSAQFVSSIASAGAINKLYCDKMADLQGRKVFKVFNQDFIVDERYNVTKELGQGAYGIVWYVTQS